MVPQTPKKTIDKGKYLELRVARMLFAEGLSPFINVYFHTALDSKSVSTPDVDVMGCRFLADATIFFAHYDCKSGDSEVISRILKLLGLRNRIPPGPIMYIRKKTSLDIKRHAMRSGIRICNISEFEKREKEFVSQIFGEYFPSISDRGVHELWLSTKGNTKSKQLGRILRYFDFEFWAEEPFSRLRRSIAAAELILSACSESGIHGNDQDLIVGCVLRSFVFSLLAAVSQVAFLSEPEVTEAVREWLITEKLTVKELQTIVESTAQLTYDIYGDPNKGPIRQQDYYVPPPDYTDELIGLLRRHVELYDVIPHLLPAFDALIVEESLLGRKLMSKALLRQASASQIEEAKRWLRSIRIFISSRQPALHDWRGWQAILLPSNGNSTGAAS
jgi:hypothetical protein